MRKWLMASAFVLMSGAAYAQNTGSDTIRVFSVQYSSHAVCLQDMPKWYEHTVGVIRHNIALQIEEASYVEIADNEAVIEYTVKNETGFFHTIKASCNKNILAIFVQRFAEIKHFNS
jgi:hypothetical protein